MVKIPDFNFCLILFVKLTSCFPLWRSWQLKQISFGRSGSLWANWPAERSISNWMIYLQESGASSPRTKAACDQLSPAQVSSRLSAGSWDMFGWLKSPNSCVRLSSSPLFNLTEAVLFSSQPIRAHSPSTCSQTPLSRGAARFVFKRSSSTLHPLF